MTTDEPTDEQLKLVARHGSSPLNRALAAARFARRHDAVDELNDYLDEEGGTG